ncbi:MAG: hypothetical protein KAR45_02990 [Desulfobacteraceae bacterium]|nr:hypothetical protein [Desulfobacteraceae bacterium]
MEKTDGTSIKEKKKSVCYHEGRIYFTKEAERKIFFFLTIFMLTLGVMSFAGLF